MEESIILIEGMIKTMNQYSIELITKYDSLFISIKKNSFNIYESNFNFENLKHYKLLSECYSIREIYKLINTLFVEDNFKIEENKNSLKLILISNFDNFPNVELNLNKKSNISNDTIEYLISEIEKLKKQNEIVNNNLEKKNIKNKEMEKKLEEQKTKIEYYKNELNKLNDRIKKLEEFHNNKKEIEFKQIKSITAHNRAINSISIFPSGNLISISNDQSIKIFDTNYNIIQTINSAHNENIRYINVKDENNFVTCSEDKSIKTWIKIENKFQLNHNIINAHKDWINKVIYQSNGNLISCSLDKTVKIWEDNSNKYNLICTIIHSDDCCCVCSILLIENKNILLSSGYNGTNLWNLNNFEFIYFFEGVSCYLWNGISKMDEDRLIVGDRNIKILSLSSKKIDEIEIPFRCCGIKVIEEKGIFLVVGESKNILIYRNDNYKCIKTINNAHKKDINGLIKLENDFIASFSDDGKIKIWSFKE